MYYNHNPITWSMIQLRDKPVGKLTRTLDKGITGIDTETLDGYCKLICDHTGDFSLGGDIDEILSFMTQARFRNKHNFFYNMKYDAQAVIKHLPYNNIKEIYKETKTTYGKYKLKYYPGKKFSIISNNHSHTYYDIAQFYETSLEVASKRYLGEGKALDGLDRALIGTSKKYWRDHEEQIIKYCIKDAELTARLGEFLHGVFRSEMGITPQQYTSKAGVTKEHLRREVNIPDILEVPKFALSSALSAYFGGRFEVVRRGNIGHCYDIDLTSAYPSVMAHLPDITRGVWRRVREVNQDALLGFYMAKVYIPPMRIAPLPVRPNPILTVYPCGEFITHMTKAEYDMLSDIIDIQIIRGAEYYDREPTYPFKKMIYDLFQHKRNTPKANFRYKLIKILLNALYGAQYEKIKQDNTYYAGKLFNPVYATMITAVTRCMLWAITAVYESAICAFATDGIILTEKPEIDYGKALGQWSEDIDGPTTIIRTGVYKIADRIKNRGLRSVERLRTPYGEYNDIFDYVEHNPSLTKYTVNTTRPLGLGECIAHHNKRGTANINIFASEPYDIDINRDLKRVWDDQFKNGGDLLSRSIDSMPILLTR